MIAHPSKNKIIEVKVKVKVKVKVDVEVELRFGPPRACIRL
jgi:hypothetical protein